jgi:hypothetical protein
MSFMVYAFHNGQILALESREFFDEAQVFANALVAEISDVENNWYQNKEFLDPDSGITISISDLSGVK